MVFQFRRAGPPAKLWNSLLWNPSLKDKVPRSPSASQIFLLVPLILLPLVLAGCQVSQQGQEAQKRKSPEAISGGEKGGSILERRKRQAVRLSGLPRGSAVPRDANSGGPAVSVRHARFAPNESAFGVLRANGVQRGEISSILKASRSAYPLSRVGAGNWYELARSREGVRRFLVQIDEDRQMRIYRNREGAFRSRMEQIPYEIKLVRLNVTIRDSFMRSIVEAGGSPQIAMEMAEIFEWVIDFHKDLNEGDRIDALIERRFLYGRPSGFGRILAARFAVGKKTHEAVYFARGSEVYYTPEGKSLRRAFLRSPLRYTRISSRFSKRRLHPILRRYRPHYGVDYAAPKGTPVRAVADGQVVWASWKGAAGKMVRIRHERGYTTEYLHLSGFARGMRRGKRVAQGKVIGYVGSTGLSTGPHLDFRIKHFGRPVDPISASSPAGKSIHRKMQVAFQRVVRNRYAQLMRAPALKPPADFAAVAPKRPAYKGN